MNDIMEIFENLLCIKMSIFKRISHILNNNFLKKDEKEEFRCRVHEMNMFFQDTTTYMR